MEKREKILNNLVLMISSNLAYVRYLESNGQNSELDQEYCDFSSIKIAYAAFSLLLWKDEYIRKDQEKNLSSIISDQLLNEYIKKIAKKNQNNTWNIGEIVFDNNYEVIDTVRNKLAHGDYVIKTDYIELEIDDKKGVISIDDLVAFSAQIAINWDKMALYTPNKYSVIKDNNLFQSKIKHIDSEQDYDEMVDNIFYVEIKDSPLIGRVRDKEYLKLMHNYRKIVIDSIDMNIPLEKIKEIYNPVMKNNGINIELTEQKVTQLPNSNKVKKMYLKLKDDFHQLDINAQQRQLGFWFHEAIKEDMPKKAISFGLTGNEFLIKELEKNPLATLDELIAKNIETTPALPILIEKIRMTAYIVSFYVMYTYGLEQIYTSETREHIEDIYSKKMFDFSKLNLSKINPEIIDIEKEFLDFPYQVQKLAKDALELNDKYDQMAENIKGFKKSLDEEYSKEKEKKFYEQINRIRDMGRRSVQATIIAEESDKFLKERFDLYKLNRSIIEHIRNSIAHGNIKLDIFSEDGTMGTSMITFEDIYNKEDKFKLKITLRDFLSLFNQDNLAEVYSYINSNTMQYNDGKISNKK